SGYGTTGTRHPTDRARGAIVRDSTGRRWPGRSARGIRSGIAAGSRSPGNSAQQGSELNQGFTVDGFDQVVVGTGSTGSREIRFGRLRAGDQRRDRGQRTLLLPQYLQEGEAVHLRHIDIDYQ